MLLLLSGCASTPRMPVDVAMIPNDCANRQAITAWLESVAAAPPPAYQSEVNHAQFRSSVKARIWGIRYNCQRL